MASKRTQKQIFEALMAKHEPLVRDAFFASINEITDKADLGRIEAALRAGDVDGAIKHLHIDPGAYSGVTESVRSAYIDSGVATVGAMPPLTAPEGGALVIRFDVRNTRAERWLAEESSTFVTRVVEDQTQAIRRAMTDGLARGTNPRTVGLDIIGRVDRVAGRRTGGIVGLSSPQEQYVSTARQELLSNDPKQLRNYLQRARRDKRFDKYARDGIANGTKIKVDTVNKMTSRYSDKLLQLRGETIARTETLGSIHAAQSEAMQQAIDTGAVREQDVRKVWVATKDGRTRDSHRRLDGESVGVNERYSNGLKYPGDQSGPAREVANCRCTQITRIDFLSNLE